MSPDTIRVEADARRSDQVFRALCQAMIPTETAGPATTPNAEAAGCVRFPDLNDRRFATFHDTVNISTGSGRRHKVVVIGAGLELFETLETG